MLKTLVTLAALAISADVANSEQLTIYSHWPRERLELLKEAFAKVEPDIEVAYFRAGNAALATIFTTEMQQKVGRADYITSDVDFIEAFKKAGYLEKIQPTTIGELTPEATDKDGYWIPLDFSPYVMVYNTKFVPEKDAPKAWKDLLDPKWKGKIGMADPRLAGGAQIPIRYWTENLKEKSGEPPYGWSFVENFTKQDLVLTSGHPQLADFVVTGEVWIAASIGIANLKEPYENGEPVKIVWPEEGSPANIIAGAVVKDAANKDAAIKLHNFLGSQVGQAFLATAIGHTPSHPKVDFKAPDGMTLDKVNRQLVSIPPELREENTKRFIEYYEAR